MRGTRRGLMVAVLVAVPLGAAAQDERAFRTAAVADTRQTAIVEAYYQALVRELARVAGAQAEGAVGVQFRRDLERDFDGFRARYFTPDTDHRCVVRPNQRHACEVEGSVKVLALRNDFRAIVQRTERLLSNRLSFVVASGETSDPRAPYVVDKIAGAFTAAGHTVLSGGDVSRAIEEKRVDFSLGVFEARYSPVALRSAEQRAEGTLTVRFRLIDARGLTQVAVVPVTVSAQVAGASVEGVQDELADVLATRAATEIARQVNDAVIAFQAARGDAAAARERAATGARLYIVRVNGVSQRDRERIRTIREAIRQAIPDADPTLDPGQSDRTRVTLQFSTRQRVNPDDLVDVLLASGRETPGFEATYEGNNEFVVKY